MIVLAYIVYIHVLARRKITHMRSRRGGASSSETRVTGIAGFLCTSVKVANLLRKVESYRFSSVSTLKVCLSSSATFVLDLPVVPERDLLV